MKLRLWGRAAAVRGVSAVLLGGSFACGSDDRGADPDTLCRPGSAPCFEGDAGTPDADRQPDAAAPAPSYFAAALPESYESRGTVDVGATFHSAGIDASGRLAMLFSEQEADASSSSYHLRYVTRAGDASQVSPTFVGTLTVAMGVHPSGEVTVCSVAQAFTPGATTLTTRALRLDGTGRVARDVVVHETTVDEESASGACVVVVDGEDAVVFSSASAGDPRVDRVPPSEAPALLEEGDLGCAEPLYLAFDWQWARSKTGTIWTGGGCEIDLKTGRAVGQKENLRGRLLTIDTAANGSSYFLGVGNSLSDVEHTFVTDLSSSVETTLVPEDPFSDRLSGVRRTRFLYTEQGWTMPEGLASNIAFRHAATLGGATTRIEFTGPYAIERTEIAKDDLWIIGRYAAPTELAGSVLTPSGAKDAQSYFVARFQDWSSIVAAHGR